MKGNTPTQIKYQLDSAGLLTAVEFWESKFKLGHKAN